MTRRRWLATALAILVLAAGATLWWWVATADTRAAKHLRDSRLKVCVAIIQTGDPQFDEKLDDCLARFG